MEIPELCEGDFKIDITSLKIGGEAIVYKGNYLLYGDVAVKKYREAFCGDEIKILKENIHHPNIIRIIGILTDSNTPPRRIGYIMSYMKMGSLGDIIHDKSTSYDDIYTSEQITIWIIKICCGLSYLHSRKIIHRDIKPSNVLLGESYDDVQLSDFGIARSISGITHRSLTTGRGTLFYMAPEMLERQNYDLSVDIYSLSITIWEILHRKNPYDHVTVQLHLPYKISNGERPQLNNNLLVEVSGLLKRCWDADPSKRPTIDYVQEFCRKTIFTLIGLEDDVNECETSFRNLNVHNDESFSKTITANNVESGGAQNELTVVRTRASNNGESLPQIPLKKPNENFHTPNSVEESSEEQTILLVGGVDGKDKDSLLMLENNGQNWKQLNIKLPYATYGHGAQFINNNIYIFGGYNENHRELDWTYKLSKSLQWEKMADMNQKRSYISNSNVILNNQIWVCGGLNENERLKSVEMYDPLTNEWKYMKEMNECRSEAAAAVVNGKIFCSGGIFDDSVECYDPSSDVWTLISNMPQKIWGHGAVEIDGYFIVMGGWNSKEGLKNVWALDTMDKNAKWIEKPSMSRTRSWFSIAKIHHKIFICGGRWDAGDSVKIFDGKVWRNGPNMPTTRRFAPAVVIPIEFARCLN